MFPANLVFSGILALFSCGDPFSPETWLRDRKVGKFTVVTPQSGKPVEPIAAQTLAQWLTEREGYLKAYRELIGPWPAARGQLNARELEKTVDEKWTRIKVAFSSLPGDARHAKEVRAWLFVPVGRRERLPALIALHQRSRRARTSRPASRRRSPGSLSHATTPNAAMSPWPPT